jgi:PAS domain S-box-containing protein
LVWSCVDIRTKLIFALVAVSLGSMFVLGLVVSPRVEGYITGGAMQRLDELAEARAEALHWIVAGWREGADLVASRTELRRSLDQHGRTGDEAAAVRIRTILSDALAASRSATLFAVYGMDGEEVASVQRGEASPVLPAADRLRAPGSGDASYVGVTAGDGSPPQVTFLVPMVWEGRPVGALVAVFAAPELLELTESREGLGETGETLILAGNGSGGLRPLHPTRHAGAPVGGASLADGPSTLAARAIAGDTVARAGGVVDYRGEEVWAATRRVDDTGWGLVVKLDREEGMEPILEFNAWLRRTAVVLSAFAILVGLVLALRFALPIHALSEVANRIRHGDMGARANADSEDEVGLLARTFNGMADELEQRMTQLHEFRKFFDVTIDLMCIAGTDGYFKRVNPAFVRTLGWSEAELLERPFYDLTHPEDLASTEKEVAKLAEGIPTISFENRFRCRDGGYKRLRWTSYPEDGRLYAIAHVIEQT